MHNKLFNKYTINGEYKNSMGFPGGAVVKKICLSIQEEAIDKDLITQSLGWKDPLEEEWHPNLGFLTGESQERGVWQATVHSISKTWTQLSDSTNTRKSSIQQQTKKKERNKKRKSIIQNKNTQFSSVSQFCSTLCNPMGWSMPGFPVFHSFLEMAQTHVHQVSDAIQPSHPLSSPSPPAINLSQHQGLFQRVSSSYQVAKVLEVQLQHQSF